MLSITVHLWSWGPEKLGAFSKVTHGQAGPEGDSDPGLCATQDGAPPPGDASMNVN